MNGSSTSTSDSWSDDWDDSYDTTITEPGFYSGAYYGTGGGGSGGGSGGSPSSDCLEYVGDMSDSFGSSGSGGMMLMVAEGDSGVVYLEESDLAAETTTAVEEVEQDSTLTSTATGLTSAFSGGWFASASPFRSTGLGFTSLVCVEQDSPTIEISVDSGGNIRSISDALGNQAVYGYDAMGNVTTVTDPNGDVVHFGYDEAGNLTEVVDPLGNETDFSYTDDGQVATETIVVDGETLTRDYDYDDSGNLVREVDRNGRVIDYAYDNLSRQTTETWYDDVTDADAQQDAVKTYSATYDVMSRVATIGDGDYDFEYTYSIFGNLTSTTQDLTGLSDDVVFNYTYDVLGRQTSVAATIGSTDDYVNTYSYDNLGRITQITQSGVSGGNSVAEKRVDYTYNDDSTRATISRYADLAGTTAVAETEKVFDELGRVTDIVHERAATEFADYDLAWDAASELTDFDFESLVGDYGETDYTYDDTGQLTAADYVSDWQDDESYTYDSTGNRTLVDGTTTYTTGDHNRLTSDGTYNYTYDGEGNVLTKTNISTGESVEYTWDHRNRLTKVTFKNSGGTATKIVEYAYDAGQQWVRKTLDTDADGTIESSRIFVHDNGQIVLDFEKTGTGNATNSDLSRRYLWDPSGVDAIIADETVDDGTEDDVAWSLTDHLASVRDLVLYDPTTETISVTKHVIYDAYGNVTSDTATGVESLFLYTARPYDPDTELQNNLNRWYDATTGRWLSVDPIGFQAGDVNLYRYAGNNVAALSDPSGLRWHYFREGQPTAWAVPDYGDTFADLANEIGLNGKEVENWAKLYHCDITGTHLEFAPPPYSLLWPVITIAEVHAHRTLRPACVHVEIPNTILATWMGDLWGVGQALVKWKEDQQDLRDLGFFVQSSDRRSIVNDLATLTHNKQLHGTFTWGHGTPFSFGSRLPFVGQIDHSFAVNALHYKLGLVIHNFCHGGWTRGENFKTWWYVVDGLKILPTKITQGTVVHGGKDWVSDSPGRKFYGIKKTLVPRERLLGAGKIVPADIASRSPLEVIHPGEQGTTWRRGS